MWPQCIISRCLRAQRRWLHPWATLTKGLFCCCLCFFFSTQVSSSNSWFTKFPQCNFLVCVPILVHNKWRFLKRGHMRWHIDRNAMNTMKFLSTVSMWQIILYYLIFRLKNLVFIQETGPSRGFFYLTLPLTFVFIHLILRFLMVGRRTPASYSAEDKRAITPLFRPSKRQLHPSLSKVLAPWFFIWTWSQVF